MARVLRVGNSDYKIVVENGGTITLDTTDTAEDKAGTVIITGDLEVKGVTTTVDSTVMTVADNIIVLSKDNIASGLPASLNFRSGIEIERGSEPNALFVYDEQISWTLGGSSGQGTFTFEQGGNTVPIKTSGIVSGSTLYVQPGAGTISVTNTVDYEERVWTYVAGTITDGGSGVIIDDDNIPNAKAVADYVDYVFSSTFQDRISENDTYVETKDFQTTGLESTVEIGVNNIVAANFFENRLEIFDLKIQGSEISTTVSNGDLLLNAPGTGSVKVKDILEITETPSDDDILSDPTAPAEGVKIYSKTEAEGGSGIYFVNKNTTQDEIISRNRALVFSMLF